MLFVNSELVAGLLLTNFWSIAQLSHVAASGHSIVDQIHRKSLKNSQPFGIP